MASRGQGKGNRPAWRAGGKAKGSPGMASRGLNPPGSEQKPLRASICFILFMPNSGDHSAMRATCTAIGRAGETSGRARRAGGRDERAGRAGGRDERAGGRDERAGETSGRLKPRLGAFGHEVRLRGLADHCCALLKVRRGRYIAPVKPRNHHIIRPGRRDSSRPARGQAAAARRCAAPCPARRGRLRPG
jgi:hypothetical protein